jgi:putative transposase
VQQGLSDQEFKTIDEAVNKGWPLASHAFKADLERKTMRQILPAKRGRPPKKTSPPAA